MRVMRDILGGAWSAAHLTMLFMLLLGFGTALNSGLVLGLRLVGGPVLP